MGKLAGFALELVDTPDGPLLALDDPECRGLCRLINASAAGELSDFFDRVVARERVEFDGATCEPPPPSTDLSAARAGFLERTGLDPEDDGGFVLVDGEPYPVYTIGEVLDALNGLRDEWRRERRRAKALGRQRAHLAAIRPAADPLFSCAPTGGGPPLREALADLEARARTLDELEAALPPAPTEAAAATASAKRRVLLVELYGVPAVGSARPLRARRAAAPRVVLARLTRLVSQAEPDPAGGDGGPPRVDGLVRARRGPPFRRRRGQRRLVGLALGVDFAYVLLAL